jgi:hypothetical protein
MEPSTVKGHDAGFGSGSALNVMLLYEDAETGLRAKLSLAVVQERGLLETGFRTKLWRRDLLRTSGLCEQAAIEAAAADVIILSLHGHEGLPDEVTDWLSRWLAHKTDRPCALGVLLDAPLAAQGRVDPVANYLKRVAAVAGADLLWGFCEASSPGWDATEQRAAPRPRFDSWEPSPDSYPAKQSSHWGINE